MSNVPAEVELEPQSLAHVTMTNAQELLKRRVKREEYLKRRAEMAEKRKFMDDKDRLRTLNVNRNGTDATASSDKLSSGKSANVTSSISIPIKDLQSNIKRTAGSIPRRRGRSKGTPIGSHDLHLMMPFVLFITFCSVVRLCFNFALYRTFGDLSEEETEEERDNSNRALSFLSGGTQAARLRRRARAQLRQRQFQSFVDRLNAQRISNGERPIGADSLRLVVSDRDFNGNDYDRLWQFHEENGPAMGSLFSTIGATEAEIQRCPSRVLREEDDLARGEGERHSCSVCLESYRAGDEVRTIPCFHTFHTGCIDPWLASRAECPVCKHSAIG